MCTQGIKNATQLLPRFPRCVHDLRKSRPLSPREIEAREITNGKVPTLRVTDRCGAG